MHADSDNLQDLRELLLHVVNSNVLILFQSKKVLERPWCLLELYTAVTHHIPIIALNCAGKGYDFNAASTFLTHLDTALAKVNKTSPGVLSANGVELNEAAHVLSSVVPNIISIPLNTSASRTAITRIIRVHFLWSGSALAATPRAIIPSRWLAPISGS